MNVHDEMSDNEVLRAAADSHPQYPWPVPRVWTRSWPGAARGGGTGCQQSQACP